jgi:chromosome segregation protein
MFIKKLELLGFKTFADKTEIEFSDGITAIVGPNGSGKSNIADALLWVLGESNVRNLRGQRAIDVIFNGSEKRRPLGLAEVSLTLDNTCGTLPLNFSEVTVTRRTYRSGEAEYFINRTRCRLKDIYELFLDTGIGREAYSFVTQGEIDAILSAKPEDRRELFEEAAGIKKYRYRREEALRKLERTEANLTRVCDIMAEISGQLEPLAEQAEIARRYQELQSRLWDIEIGLLIRDLRRNTKQLEEAREQKARCRLEIEECNCRLTDLENEKANHSARLIDLEQQVDEARKVEQALSTDLQRLEGTAAVIEEKLKSAQWSSEQADAEIRILETKIAETTERIGRLESDERSCVESEERVRAAVSERSALLEELDKRFEEASRIVSDQKASYLEVAKDLAAKRNALQNSQERVAQLEAALRKYEDEIGVLETQHSEAVALREEAASQSASLSEQIADIAAKISQLDGERSRIVNEEANLRTMHSRIASDIAARSARLATLKEMAEAHEGFYEGVRSVMAAQKAGRIPGSFAVIADVITVPKGFENAIETALGAAVQDVIADSVESAKKAIEFLKSNRAGRATFLPLDGMKPSEGNVRGKMDRRTGALGIAADLISYDRKYDIAIRSLLGRTVIADNIDNAVVLSRQLAGWAKIVTLDGELIMPSGAITGGTLKSKGPGLLLRKQEMDSLAAEIRELEARSAEVQSKQKKLECQLAEVTGGLENAEKCLAELRIALAEQQKREDFAAKEVVRIANQLHTVRMEADEATQLMNREAEAVLQLQEDLKTVGQENTDLDRRVADIERDLEELQKQRMSEREELMRLNAELAGCVERTAAIRNSLEELRNNLGELRATLAERRSQADRISADMTGLVSEHAKVIRECEKHRSLAEAARNSLADLISRRSEEQSKVAEIDARIKEIGGTRNRLAQESHDAEIREARLEVQVNQAADRLLTEYELTYDQAMEWPEEEIEVERGAATEVARLRREIKEMGPVNTGAVQEYERIKERWDFLSEQRSDLESAKAQINQAIAEIDANTRGLFMSTFSTVAKNFDTMFTRLFGGGKTSISLTNPNDLLETGIDVAVQPPGKKMQDMSLLSGGERALTATALIFALLMVKPSPFVVLDEVDAPLDEANVERFADMLKEFAANSQFIVITHNRATMEASDCLYGVTMQEPGVSKLISVKLTSEGPVDREVETAAAS